MPNLCSAITELKGIGPKKAAAFEKMGLFCMEDSLRYFPVKYEDLRNVKEISSLINEEKALVEATVLLKLPGRGYGRKRTWKFVVSDGSREMSCIFLNAAYVSNQLSVGNKYRFYGKAKVDENGICMFNPSFSLWDGTEKAGILPIYPLKSGVSQKDIRKVTAEALKLSDNIQESLPAGTIEKAKLCPISYALQNIHYPKGEEEYRQARYRLIYEELFYLRAALNLSKNRFGSGRKGNSFKTGSSIEFIESRNFKPTEAQLKAINQISQDMDKDIAMNRLLQGDVGSGKTFVAEAAIFKAVKAGFQAAFMAPTEILALQHFKTLKEDFEPFGISVALLTGSMLKSEKKQIVDKLKKGEIDICIGTHALISEDVEFLKLGLVITDEQHRFGVNQRKKLSSKAENPDILVMTATPIPRTLAVVLYSDLDISIINQLPAGRKPVITQSYNSATRKNAYKKLTEEVQKGRQAYIVAPSIEDGGELESAEGLFEDFTSEYPEIKAAILHGNMSKEEKESAITAFSEGKISVLISTVVIEVGINVPNASVMLIENCERFGLAQLHQLRGRVGRSDMQSYCFLVVGEESELARERAEILCNSSDGFYIAEKDLELRGPGELFGFRQHGLPQLQLADPVKHIKVIEKASSDCDELFSADPLLSAPENEYFRKRVCGMFAGNINLVL